MQWKCLVIAKEVATCRARWRPGFSCFCGPGSEQTWKYNEARPTSHFSNWGWDKLASVMTSELVTSKHAVCKCSNMLQTGILTSKKGEAWNALQKKSRKSHAHEHGIGVQSTLFVFRSEHGFSLRCQFSFLSPTTVGIRKKSQR